MFDPNNPLHLRERAEAIEAPEGTEIEIETEAGWATVTNPIWAHHHRYRVRPNGNRLLSKLIVEDVDQREREMSAFNFTNEQAAQMLSLGNPNEDPTMRSVEAIRIGRAQCSVPKMDDSEMMDTLRSAWQAGWRPKAEDADQPNHLVPPAGMRFLHRHDYIKGGDLYCDVINQDLTHYEWSKVPTGMIGDRYYQNGHLWVCRKDPHPLPQTTPWPRK